MSMQNSAQNLSRSFGTGANGTGSNTTTSQGIRKSVVMKQIQKEAKRKESFNSKNGGAAAAGSKRQQDNDLSMISNQDRSILLRNMVESNQHTQVLNGSLFGGIEKRSQPH